MVKILMTSSTQFLNEAKEEAVIRVKAEDVIYRTQMTKDAG